MYMKSSLSLLFFSRTSPPSSKRRSVGEEHTTNNAWPSKSSRPTDDRDAPRRNADAAEVSSLSSAGQSQSSPAPVSKDKSEPPTRQDEKTTNREEEQQRVVVEEPTYCARETDTAEVSSTSVALSTSAVIAAAERALR